MESIDGTARRFQPRAYSPYATFVATTEDVNDLVANHRDLFDREIAILTGEWKPQTFDEVWGDVLERMPDEHVEQLAYHDNRADRKPKYGNFDHVWDEALRTSPMAPLVKAEEERLAAQDNRASKANRRSRPIGNGGYW